MAHEFFTIGEMLFSQKALEEGINNCKTTPQIEANLDALIENVLDPLRRILGKPVIISSGFRCEALNKAVGGSKTSQHMYGEACDIQIAGGKETDLQKAFAILSKMDVDQLLFERNSKGKIWIHVSYKANGGNRNYKNNNYKA